MSILSSSQQMTLRRLAFGGMTHADAGQVEELSAMFPGLQERHWMLLAYREGVADLPQLMASVPLERPPSKNDALVGKTILSIFRNPDSTLLRFVTVTGEIIGFGVFADCCSTSWIEEVLNPDQIIGHRVLRCFDLEISEAQGIRTDVPDYPPSGRQEVDKTYGWQIDTTGGSAKVIFRNSSNGSYGGSLELSSEDAQWKKIA